MTKITSTDAEKREALRAKIDAGETRQAARGFADQAKAAADNAFDYVKSNPLKSVATVAVGALIIGAMTRPGRRASKKAGKFASLATDAAIAYALGLFDGEKSAAHKGQDHLADFSLKARKSVQDWQNYAAKEGSELSDYLVAAAKRSGKRASKTIDDLRGRLTN